MSKPLLIRNTRFLLAWLPIVLLVCSVIFYFMLQMHAHHMQEKQLFLKQHNVWNTFLAKSSNIEHNIKGEYTIYEGLLSPTIEADEPRDTVLFYADTKESLSFKVLSSQVTWNNKPFVISTFVSAKEVTHLIIKVFITEACILLLLLIAIIILNRKSSAFVWKPFFSTMQKTKDYDITRHNTISLPPNTGTTEFDTLNEEITALVLRANKAFLSQKQFVENASHEMQTPLSIIRSKLELLINQPGITETVAILLADITEANNRLSQMNRNLLLLAKIENNQFPEKESVDVSQMLMLLIEDFKNHYENCPEMSINISSHVTVSANPSLIEILLSNLLKNAIVHNIVGGKVKITLSPGNLLVANTGNQLHIAPEFLFQRFVKGSYQSKTTGLGLALAQQICNLYHYTIKYTYVNGWHTVELGFKE